MSNMSIYDAGLLPCGLVALEVPRCPHFVSLPGPKTSQKELIESSYKDTVCVSEGSTIHAAAGDSREANNG